MCAFKYPRKNSASIRVGVGWTQYVWSPVYVDALILRDRDPDGQSPSANERLYAAHDASFSVSAVFDTSGNVIERYQTDPFGKATVLTPAGAPLSSSTVAWDRLHQGLEWVAEAGLYANRARWLSPTLAD